MSSQSTKQIGRESSNRSNTPQKTTGGNLKKAAGGHYDNYQMAASGTNQLGGASK